MAHNLKTPDYPQTHDRDYISKPTSVSDSLILTWAQQILKDRYVHSHYITSPDATREYLNLKLMQKEHEVFGMVFLNSQHGVLGYEELFRGTIDCTSVYPREVIKTTLRYNAAAVILVHNHPSGCAEPSTTDRQLTDRIKTALNTIDIRVLDHLIVAGASIVSFAERGLL